MADLNELQALIGKYNNVNAPIVDAPLWNPTEAAKQFVSGGLEGGLGLLGLAKDIIAPSLGMMPGGPDFSMPTSRMLVQAASPITVNYDPNYRYSRRVGEFLGGNVLIPGGSTTKSLIGAVSGGLGSQGLEDFTGEHSISPVVGGMFGGALPEAVTSIWKMGRSLFRGATPEEIKGSAALAQRQATGLTADQISQAIENTPNDAMGKLATTAEITKNPGMAQIEKTLATSDEPARIYANRMMARDVARNAALADLADAPISSKEAVGNALIQKAQQVKAAMSGAANQLWGNVPRNAIIEIGPEQKLINSIMHEKQGGLPIKGQVNDLLDQFANSKESTTRTSGHLQDIRSDALTLLRDKTLTGMESRLLSTLQSAIDDAMERGLTGESYDMWKTARAATSLQKETFSKKTAGGALINKNARPANVLRNAFSGDAQSVREIKAAIAKDPALMEQVKSSILDSVPRDRNGQLTTAGMKKFLEGNKEGLQELFGADHYAALERILADLQSSESVGGLAFAASRGNSVTAQRQTVAGAIGNLMNTALVPKAGKTLGKVAETARDIVTNENNTAIANLIFRAAMEPEYALELANTPTTKRVFSLMDHLTNIAATTTIGGIRGGVAGAGVPNQALNNASLEELQSIINKYQKKNPMTETPKPKATPDQIAESLRDAVIQQESAGKPKAVSPKGAVGLMQIMPSTAREIASELGVDSYDLTDPETNKRFGMHYLTKMLRMFDNDPKLALAAYNAGPNAVARWIKRWDTSDWDTISANLKDKGAYLETVNYVPSILSKIEKV